MQNTYDNFLQISLNHQNAIFKIGFMFSDHQSKTVADLQVTQENKL